MATRRGNKPVPQVKDLQAKKLTGKQAKAVKGGGNIHLQSTRMADGSVRPASGWDLMANKKA